MRHARNHLESWMKGLCRLISQHVFSEQTLAASSLSPPALPGTRNCDTRDIMVTRCCSQFPISPDAASRADDVPVSADPGSRGQGHSSGSGLGITDISSLLHFCPLLLTPAAAPRVSPLAAQLAILRLKTRPGFCSWPARARHIFDVLRTLSLAAARKQQPIF